MYQSTTSVDMPVSCCSMEDRMDSRSPGQGAVASEGTGGQEVDSGGKRNYNLDPGPEDRE